MFGEVYWERIGLLKPGTGFLGVTWRKRKSFREIINKLFTDCPFLYIGPQRFFRNYMDNSDLQKQWNKQHRWKICGNERSNCRILSNTYWCSLPNGSIWLEVAESAAGRMVLLQILSIHGGTVGMKDLDVMHQWLGCNLIWRNST